LGNNASKIVVFLENREAFIQSCDGSLQNKTAPEVKKLVGKWLEGRKEFMLISRLSRDGVEKMVQTMTIESDYSAYKDLVLQVAQPNEYSAIFDEMSQEDVLRIAKYYSLENFYKVFGKPEKRQYLSILKQYNFLYSCEDGTVQFAIPEQDLEENGVVGIVDFNII
jgi:hypothetical protein